MNAVPALRARCIYRLPLTPFEVSRVYEFAKHADYTSFSVYKPLGVESCYATRLLDECSVIVIEDNKGAIAVFVVC